MIFCSLIGGTATGFQLSYTYFELNVVH